jgi:hypothetical protein
MNPELRSFKARRSFFFGVNQDSILEVPIESELLSESELETIAEITEETLNSTIENWKRIAKETEYEEILNAEAI